MSTLKQALLDANLEENDHIFFVKPECLLPDYEYEWDRVKRMRAEHHPLISGGRNNGVKIKFKSHFYHKNSLSQRKFNLLDEEFDGEKLLIK